MDSVADATGARDLFYDREQQTEDVLDAEYFGNLVVATKYQAEIRTTNNTSMGRFSGVQFGTVNLTTGVMAPMMAVSYSYDDAGRASAVDTAYPGLTKHHDYHYLSSSSLWDKVTTGDYSVTREFEPKGAIRRGHDRTIDKGQSEGGTIGLLRKA